MNRAMPFRVKNGDPMLRTFWMSLIWDWFATGRIPTEQFSNGQSLIVLGGKELDGS